MLIIFSNRHIISATCAPLCIHWVASEATIHGTVTLVSREVVGRLQRKLVANLRYSFIAASYKNYYGVNYRVEMW